MSFIRQDAHKKKRLAKTWRKPKGIQSKMRLGKKGYPKVVKTGYGTKNRHSLERKSVVLITNVGMLEKFPENSVGIVSGKIGGKKKITIIETAKEKNIVLVNANENTLKIINEKLAKRKEDKKKKIEAKKKEEKKKEPEKGEETPKTEEKKVPEEKKEDDNKERREKEKALIKKGAV